MYSFCFDVFALFWACPEIYKLGLLPRFLLTPITSLKNVCGLKSGFSLNGMSSGSMLTILYKARLYRTISFVVGQKMNRLFLNSFSM